jgi:hypothetical protein
MVAALLAMFIWKRNILATIENLNKKKFVIYSKLMIAFSNDNFTFEEEILIKKKNG